LLVLVKTAFRRQTSRCGRVDFIAIDPARVAFAIKVKTDGAAHDDMDHAGDS
jgi:hypothetical protein